MTISIELPKDVETKWQMLMANSTRNELSYLTEAVIDYIDDVEDYFIAKQQVEDIKAGKIQTIPIEEIMKEYGMVN
jgi:RHH-type rel operon transcriptional repressor/antitoxin RelB